MGQLTDKSDAFRFFRLFSSIVLHTALVIIIELLLEKVNHCSDEKESLFFCFFCITFTMDNCTREKDIAEKKQEHRHRSDSGAPGLI